MRDNQSRLDPLPSKQEFPVTTECPECSAPVAVPSDVLEGELIVCDTCGVELEVLGTDPLAVALFEEEEK